MRRSTSRWLLGVGWGHSAMPQAPSQSAAQLVLCYPPPAHPSPFFLCFFLFSGFCCSGALCLSCTLPVWLSLRWPSQTMSCSLCSLTVFPPIMPPGSSPWCVYVSISFSRTRSLPQFCMRPLKWPLKQGWAYSPAVWGHSCSPKSRREGPRTDTVPHVGRSVPPHLPARSRSWRAHPVQVSHLSPS